MAGCIGKIRVTQRRSHCGRDCSRPAGRTDETRAVLTHRTAASGVLMSAAMGHVVDGPEGTESVHEAVDDMARITITADVSPGHPLRFVKFLAYGWSAQRSMYAVRDQVGFATSGEADIFAKLVFEDLQTD